MLAGPRLSWLRALVTSTTIIQGASCIGNPIRCLLSPCAGQRVDIAFNDTTPTSPTVFGAARSYGEHKSNFKAVEIIFNKATKLIHVTIFEDRRDVSVPLHLQFECKPSTGFAPIHEIVIDRNNLIKEFYWNLWHGDDERLPNVDIHETFVGPEVAINAEMIEKFVLSSEAKIPASSLQEF
jgi:fatty acid synthase subunit alpha, fungi type